MDRQPKRERHDAAQPQGRGSEDDLFRLHHQRLVARLQRRLGISREMAEDAVAFAWMQLVRREPEHDNLIGWLYTVAKHEAFAMIRATTRERPVDEIEPGVSAPTPTDILETRRVLALVARLKPQQRTVLRLRMAGLSYQEICRRTGHTYTWVNRHITEGRQVLRRLIEESDP
jgi:RNA polymerase sigma factor (sigma-70 family)